MNSNNITSNEINFAPGREIEIYFPGEMTQYRFKVATDVLDRYENFLVVDLPNECKNTFYKGEDYIQCTYADGNVVYQFGGEIVKIIFDFKSYVIIRKPANLKRDTLRAKNRVVTNILGEYFVESVAPGQRITRMQGFVKIKDASTGGLSFLTTDDLPSGTILKVVFCGKDIVMHIEVKSTQRVNDKNFYGGRIIDYIGNSETVYKKMIESLMQTDGDVPLSNNVYSGDGFYN